MRDWINKTLFNLTTGMPIRIINIDDKPYLERYYVGSLFGATAYLHRFVGSDGDREVHDHPWRWAFAIVLCGLYFEERLTAFDPESGWLYRFRPVRWFNLIGQTTFHRISVVRPGTWTLFIHGPRTKGWGFLKRSRVETGAVDGVLYYQPFDVSGTRDWHLKAENATCTGRQPL